VKTSDLVNSNFTYYGFTLPKSKKTMFMLFQASSLELDNARLTFDSIAESLQEVASDKQAPAAPAAE
ncbi:MAG: hypothetical protein N2C12_10400, partial [Planctomycetales bacterium]